MIADLQTLIGTTYEASVVDEYARYGQRGHRGYVFEGIATPFFGRLLSLGVSSEEYLPQELLLVMSQLMTVPILEIY